MDEKVFRAILAMDAYNRGYRQGIDFLSDAVGTWIGDAYIIRSSDVRDPATAAASFYALAYDWESDTVISYRGTDESLKDDATGYGTGRGRPLDIQAQTAINFYNDVMAEVEEAALLAGDPVGDVLLVGHSLGGGLAGLVGALYGEDAVVFDNMPFRLAAQRLYDLAVENPGTPAEMNPEMGLAGTLSPSEMIALVYGDEAPWAPRFDQIQAYAVPHYGIGQQINWLSALRGLVGQPIENNTALRFPADVPLGWTWSYNRFGQAHDPALMVIRTFLEDPASKGALVGDTPSTATATRQLRWSSRRKARRAVHRTWKSSPSLRNLTRSLWEVRGCGAVFLPFGILARIGPPAG